MLIGIVSDTHGQVDLTLQVVRIFENLKVEQVIHCGDIGPAVMVELFEPWPTHFVLGNCDNRLALSTAIEAAGQTCHDRFGSLDLEGKKIAFLHGDDHALLQKTVHEDRWDLVCYGHVHVAGTSVSGRTLVLNPGALCGSDHPSVAVVRLPSMEVIPVRI
jgi:putative phosphoesterase